MKLSDPTIAKEKYRNRKNLTKQVSYSNWVEFIDNHQGYFIWQEDTEEGKETLKNLDKIPESFREGILKSHNRSRAFAEYNEKKGYYEIYIDYIELFGTVSTTFQKKIEKRHLEILLDMADYLDALLLNNGTEIIDRDYLKKVI